MKIYTKAFMWLSAFISLGNTPRRGYQSFLMYCYLEEQVFQHFLVFFKNTRGLYNDFHS